MPINLDISTNYSRSLNEVDMVFDTSLSRVSVYLFDSDHEQEGVFIISSDTDTSTITAEFSTKESPEESDFTPFTFLQQSDINYSNTGETESDVHSAVLHSNSQRIFFIPPFAQIIRFRGETNSDHDFRVLMVTQRDIEVHSDGGSLTTITPGPLPSLSDNESADIIFTLDVADDPQNTKFNRLFRLTGESLTNATVDKISYLDDDKYIMTITKLAANAFITPTITPAHGGAVASSFLFIP